MPFGDVDKSHLVRNVFIQFDYEQLCIYCCRLSGAAAHPNERPPKEKTRLGIELKKNLISSIERSCNVRYCQPVIWKCFIKAAPIAFPNHPSNCPLIQMKAKLPNGFRFPAEPHRIRCNRADGTDERPV